LCEINLGLLTSVKFLWLTGISYSSVFAGMRYVDLVTFTFDLLTI